MSKFFKSGRKVVAAGLAVTGAVLAHAADYASPAAAVTAIDGAAATTTTAYLAWVTLGVGTLLVGAAVWAFRKGIALKK